MKNREKGPTLIRPRQLEPGEFSDREWIASRFPGGVFGTVLSELAALLRLGELRLHVCGIDRNPGACPEAIVPVAISQESHPKTRRAVLCAARRFAHRVVDMAMGRVPGPGDRPLTSGEEGALLYALDRVGGDWLAAGGSPFFVRGFLADAGQVGDYLGGAPDWQVALSVRGEDLDGVAWLWFKDPVPMPDYRANSFYFSGSAAMWPVALRISVGLSRVRFSDLKNLGIGDIVVLDGWSHPDSDRSAPEVTVYCGEWRRYGRWLDRRRLEVVSEEERGIAMDTKSLSNKEMTAVLEQTSCSDAGSMEVVVKVEVGQVKMPMSKAAGLVPGRILSLDRDVGPQVSLVVGDRLIGRGELVENKGTLAVEVTEVI